MSDLRKVPSKLKMPPDWDEALDGEWDDEMASPEALAEGADIQLIVEYLNHKLEPDLMEGVRRRLAEDASFAKLAEPIIYIWSIPRYLERHPRPAGELERHWDEFTKRAGFAHQRRKVRRRRVWLLGIAFFLVGVTGFLARGLIADWYVTQREFSAVASAGTTGWIPLGDSLFFDPAPGASLRVRREPVDEKLHVILDGEARFLVSRRDTMTPTPFHQGIVVRTRAGFISAEEAEFTVASRGDTTEVQVHRPSKRSFIWFIPRITGVYLRRELDAEPLPLGELGRGRLVRGKDQHPTLLPKAQEP
jgi:hypothetical protein